MNFFVKTFKHLNKILTHKRWVAHYCFMCGRYWQGITHDLSKFSPTEFWESVKYYQGTRSPIEACKEDKGYSMAWFHHRGRNKHHYEYWMDDFEKGFIPKKMPFKYVLEMICDHLAAGRAYVGNKFTMEAEWEWWQKKRPIVKMHKDTFGAIDQLMNDMKANGIETILKDKDYVAALKKKYENGEF